MALTRATDKIIANADGNLNLSGIVTASLAPSGDLNVGNNIKLGTASGIITATSFSGDGSNLTSLPAGLGTALSSTQTSPLNKLYYTNEILSIGATVTVDHPATGTGAYTQYADIRLEEGADLIIEDGDDVIPDILGLGTDGGGLGAGGTGRIRVDSITNKNANGAPTFPNGAVVTGIITATNVSAASSVTATTFYGSGANLTGISVDTTKIETGNTKVETVDTGSDGHVKITTEGSERLRIQSDGDVGIGTIDNTNNERLRIQDDASTSTVCQVSIISGSAERSILNFGDKEDPNIGRVSYHNNTNTISLFTNNTERLIINSYGLVSAPFQYHLHAQRSNDQTGYNAQGDFGVPMIFNQIVSETKDSSLSSCFNTSTGVFTAPVLGLYHFCAATYSSGNSVFSQSWFTLNGSRAAGTDWHLSSSNYPFVNNNQVIRLAAGNTVGFKPYASGQSNLTLSANANHTFFKVTLIG